MPTTETQQYRPATNAERLTHRHDDPIAGAVTTAAREAASVRPDDFPATLDEARERAALVVALAELDYDRTAETVPLPPRPRLADAMSALTDDGDRFELVDGFALRLRIAPDEHYSVNDYDSDGRIEWTRRGDYGHTRPDGFTGRARILERDGYQACWWEPPGPDIIGPVPWDAETLDREASRVRDLVRFGFSIVTLELLQTVPDVLGGDHEVVIASASIGGVDETYPALVADLSSEIEAEVAP